MLQNKFVSAMIAAFVSATAFADKSATVKIAEGECWWGGANYFSRQMPFGEKTDLKIELREKNYSNQGASMLLSNRGRVIYSSGQSTIVIKNGEIKIDSDTEVTLEQGEPSLRGAYVHAMRKYFPPKGKTPPAEFFTKPQLNTWIELTYHQNQKDILEYAKTMIARGIPPGVIMIDDTWQAGYGDWRFEPTRFPDPKKMIDELHAMGYKVMLWMCPYVGMDLPAFRRVAWGINPDDVKGYPEKGGFLTELNSKEAKSLRWWNGYSAFIDFSHPNGKAWFTETLDGLVRDFGVDGFKLDGADLPAYDLKVCKAHDPKATSGSLQTDYVSYALRYPYSEIRNTIGMQQQPAVVRLHDKMHEWDALPRIVADMMGAGILGYPFICPDMVGGGDWVSFIPGSAFDTELFLRSAQIHALCPMMQISASPWRVLSEEEQKIFSKTVALRQKFADSIYRLAEQAAKDGEPILRSLDYNYPGCGYESVRDEFMMGTDLLVAPVLKKGEKSRKVLIPAGRWRADDGTITVGPAEIEVATPLDRLPYFIKVVDLEAGFRAPPHAARPHTWWHWMNGNVTKEGITADLEAMARIGIGGAQIFDVGCNIPPGPIAYNTPEWFDMIKHAASEARRLGIELCLPNCSGWSSSGGPWNPPENGMKFVESTETKVTGPIDFKGKLARPARNAKFYEDIAVFAVPQPATADVALSGEVREEVPGVWRVTFPSPVAAAGFRTRFDAGWIWRAKGQVAIETSDDGSTFLPLVKREVVIAESGQVQKDVRFFPFDSVTTARVFRLTYTLPKNEKIAIHDVAVTDRMPISDLAAKSFRVRMELGHEKVPEIAGVSIPKDSVIDLTKNMSADGAIEWKVPKGEWKIVRLGYAASGRQNHPASKFGVGLEVDKLSKSAMNHHFESYVAKLCRHLGPLAGNVETGLNNILVDSYEVGSQNWTQGFEEEFAKRAGYSIRPYLPALVGVYVGSVEETERFLADYRRVLADMFAENYAGALAEKCHQYGLNLSLEPYGSGPCDDLQYGQDIDIPMGEFWSGPGNWNTGVGNARVPASLAHVWGRRIVATESFTAQPGGGGGRWQKHPFSIKAQCDRAYASGVNRIIYHRFTHQPWVDGKYVPGMTMGKWGMHFDRTQTWWNYAKPWIDYQTRCQYLLQEGRSVADALFFSGEDAPNDAGSHDGIANKPVSLPYGYNWDVCAAKALLASRAENGRVVVPGGVSYAMVVLPKRREMSVAVLDKLIELARAGVKIVAEKKPVCAPGLRGWPASDAEVVRKVEELWSLGVITKNVDEAIAEIGIKPDFICPHEGGRETNYRDPSYIHRVYEGWGEGYFVAMPNKTECVMEPSFRISGYEPEVWDAETMSISAPEEWRIENGRTIVKLRFRPSGSAFVMFRKPTTAVAGKGHVPTKPSRIDTVEGPWTVSFAAGWGAPATAVFDKLLSWPDHSDEGIKYYSGTATYRKDLVIENRKPGERVTLDLGSVHEVARVRVNGKAFDPLWRPPFACDITEAVGEDGKVSLEIDVANLWANRLIGDDFLPEDCQWKKADWRQAIVELPSWVKEGKPSPTGRHTFTTWKHWSKEDKPLESGLLGPVQLKFSAF